MRNNFYVSILVLMDGWVKTLDSSRIGLEKIKFQSLF